MDIGLKGKIVLLSNGCGCGAKALAEAYHGEGAIVCACGEGAPEGVFDAYYRTPLQDEAQAEEVCAAIEAAYGLVDILVLNRFEIGTRHILDCTQQEMLDAMDYYVSSAFALARTVGLKMKAAGRGNVLVMTSLHDERPNGCDVPHSIAMGVLKNLANELSQQFGFDGVRVNQLSVGPVEGWDAQADKENTTLLVAAKYKMSPVPTWEAVAKNALYATSDLSPALNGACIRVDGALTHHYLDYIANYRAFHAGEKVLEVRQ